VPIEEHNCIRSDDPRFRPEVKQRSMAAQQPNTSRCTKPKQQMIHMNIRTKIISVWRNSSSRTSGAIHSSLRLPAKKRVIDAGWALSTRLEVTVTKVHSDAKITRSKPPLEDAAFEAVTCVPRSQTEPARFKRTGCRVCDQTIAPSQARHDARQPQ